MLRWVHLLNWVFLFQCLLVLLFAVELIKLSRLSEGFTEIATESQKWLSGEGKRKMFPDL